MNLLLLLVAGCVAGKADGDPPADSDTGGGETAETADSGDTAARSPCADGSWGEITDPARALVVATDGRPDGAGTVEDPLDHLAGALARLREAGGGGEILVAGGRHTDAEVELAAGEDGAPGDDEVLIQGCAGDTVLVGGRDDLPVLRATGVHGVRIVDLSLQGGRGALWIWGGAELGGARIQAGDTRDAAVVIDGHDTVVDLDSLWVDSVVPGLFSGGEVAVGVLVQDADVRLVAPTIEGATRYGVFLRGDGEAHGRLVVEDGRIDATRSSGEDGVGRAISAHDAVAVELGGLSVDGAGDAGVFLQGVREARVTDLEVRAVGAGLADGQPTGDGLVITGIPEDGSRYDPSLYVATVGAVGGGALERAGLLLERVTATVEEAPGLPAYAQAGAVVDGAGAGEVLPLADEEALALTRSSFDPTEIVSP